MYHYFDNISETFVIDNYLLGARIETETETISVFYLSGWTFPARTGNSYGTIDPGPVIKLALRY